MAISISGLSGSGLDTTSIIEQLMEVERLPYTTLQTKKTNLQAQQGVFRQLNTKLSALQSAMSDLRFEGTFQANTGKATNTSIASVTTTGTAVAGNYSINVENLAQYEVVKSSTTFSKSGTNLIDGNHQFVFGGKTFDLNPIVADSDPATEKFNIQNHTNEDVLNELVKRINTDTTLPATAALIDIEGNGNLSLLLTAKSAVESTTPGTATLSFTLAGATSNTTPVQEGKLAKLTINGQEIKRDSNKFDNIMTGLSIEAKAVGSTQVTIGKDTEGITEKVQKFVTAYNDAISFINLNLAKPEDDKSINPLQGDTTLKLLKDQLYDTLTQGMSYTGSEGKYGFLEELGIKIGGDVANGGKVTGLIEFDVEKLKGSIEANPLKVQELFVNTMNEGFNTLSQKYTSSYNGLIANRITGFDTQIKTTDERMEALSRSLEMKEARLKAQFTAMETMLSSLNSQSDWLSSQFESLMKTKD